MKKQSYETPGEVLLHVDNRLGVVEVHTHAVPATEVEVSATGERGEDSVARTRIEHTVSSGRHHVTVEVPLQGWGRLWQARGPDVLVKVLAPEGTSFDLRTSSGAITADGRYGQGRADSASGEVSVERVDAELRVNTASGEVRVGSAGGEVKVQTASGRVDCGVFEAGGTVKTASGDVSVRESWRDLSVSTASGDVSTGSLAAGCQVKTASGDQFIGRLNSGRTRLDSVSGDLRVGIAAGSLVAVDATTVSGTLSSEIDLDNVDPGAAGGGAEPRVDLRARTVSGDLRIQRVSA